MKDVPSKEDSIAHGEGSETSKRLEESMEEKRLPTSGEDPSQGVDHIYSTPKKPSNNGTASDMFISSFFIGISFRKDLMRADVSFAVKVRHLNPNLRGTCVIIVMRLLGFCAKSEHLDK